MCDLWAILRLFQASSQKRETRQSQIILLGKKSPQVTEAHSSVISLPLSITFPLRLSLSGSFFLTAYVLPQSILAPSVHFYLFLPSTPFVFL